MGTTIASIRWARECRFAEVVISGGTVLCILTSDGGTVIRCKVLW